MKINRKILIIIGAAVFLTAAAVITFVSIGSRDKGIKVGFYGIDSATEDIFVELVKNSFEDEKKAPSISFEHLDQADHSVDLLVMPMGKIQDDLVESIGGDRKKKPGLPLSVMSETTTSIRQKAAMLDGNVVSVPLLTDNVEIEISLGAVAMTDTRQIQTWADIEKFASESRQYYPYPIVFAGEDDETLLNVITALTEAYSGKDAYQEVLDSIREFFGESDGDMDSGEIRGLLEGLSQTPESPLYAAASTLSRWMKSGLVHPGIFNMTKRDVEIYMENHYSSIVITSLSDHRSMTAQATKDFTTIPRALGNGGNSVGFFPSSRPASQRNLTGTVISALLLSKNSNSEEVVRAMLSQDFQTKLAYKTGLAPVNAQCQSPDILSDDVRFFTAATNAPLTPLGSAAFTSEDDARDFALELRSLIKTFRN